MAIKSLAEVSGINNPTNNRVETKYSLNTEANAKDIMSAILEGKEPSGLFEARQHIVDTPQGQAPKQKTTDFSKSLKAGLNPYNWGVTDYTKSGTKGQAFNAARKAGEKEFMWNNERFSTIIKNLPGETIKKRDDFSGNILSGLANEASASSSIFGQDLVEVARENVSGVGGGFDRKKLYGKLYDSYNYYFGQPLESNILTKSKHRPSDAKNNTNNYIAINDEKFIEQVLDIANESDIRLNETIPVSGYMSDYQSNYGGSLTKEEKNERINKRGYVNSIGHFRIGKGKDEKGEYISYYDIFDIGQGSNNTPTFGTAKPFEIYDRIYAKDYGDGTQKRMYYSDKELSALDSNKKDFDTQGLQRELSNRGYKFPKSTKSDGTFDGIYGDETKSALLQYQKSNTKK